MKSSQIFSSAISFLASTASVFAFTSVVHPVSVDQEPINLVSEMYKLSLSESFSPAFAALEDDYALDHALYLEEQELEAKVLEALQQPLVKVRVAQSPQPVAPKKKSIEPTLKSPHHWLSGVVAFSETLQFEPEWDQVQIGWFVDGQLMREGVFNSQTLSYELQVDELRGEVIAELVNREEMIVAEALLDVYSWARNQEHQLKMNGADLLLEDLLEGVNVQVVSVYHDEGNRDLISDADVQWGFHDLIEPTNEDGWAQVWEMDASNSSALISVQSELNYPSVKIADLSRPQQLMVFPKPYVDAMLAQMEGLSELGSYGVIWGRVKINQKAGYQVSVVGEEDLEPFYFTSYIANPDQKETSEDGQFSIVGLNDGSYEIELWNSQGIRVDSKLVYVESGAMSPVEFDLEKKKNLFFTLFDPLNEGLQTKVSFYELGSGLTKEGEVNQKLSVPAYEGSDPVVVYAKVEGLEDETIMLAPRGKKHQDLPVLNQKWWERTQKELQIKSEDGVMVGFVDTEESFEIFIEEVNSDARVMYFDEKGWPVDRLQGEKASGFVVYNMGEGLHTLILKTESGALSSEAVYLDGSSVSLFYKNLSSN